MSETLEKRFNALVLLKDVSSSGEAGRLTFIEVLVTAACSVS